MRILSQCQCEAVLETARKGVAPDPLYAAQYLLPRLGGGEAPAIPAKAAPDAAPFEVIGRCLALDNRKRRYATLAEMKSIRRENISRERREMAAHKAAMAAERKAADIEAAWVEHDHRG